MSSKPSLVLQAENIHFAYPENTGVLEDINICVRPGERVGLIGPNGAGKTTFFLLACGILQPASGQILLMDRPVSAREFNPKVALVFQKPDDQLFCPSVREDVAFGPQNMGLRQEEVEHRVQKALRTVGGSSLAARPVHHLSEGEKRIISIAGALAMQPELIIYDEPSAALDIRCRRRLISLMQNSAQTILVASHDLELILEVCTRVILMDQGRTITQGDPVQVMGNAELMQAHGQEKPHSLVPHQIPHPH